METLIGVFEGKYGEEFTVVVDLNAEYTIQTAFEDAIEKLEDITGDNVNGSDVVWYSAKRLNVGKTVTYTLE